jgi:hypothetical protein
MIGPPMTVLGRQPNSLPSSDPYRTLQSNSYSAIASTPVDNAISNSNMILEAIDITLCSALRHD